MEFCCDFHNSGQFWSCFGHAGTIFEEYGERGWPRNGRFGIKIVFCLVCLEPDDDRNSFWGDGSPVQHIFSVGWSPGRGGLTQLTTPHFIRTISGTYWNFGGGTNSDFLEETVNPKIFIVRNSFDSKKLKYFRNFIGTCSGMALFGCGTGVAGFSAFLNAIQETKLVVFSIFLLHCYKNIGILSYCRLSGFNEESGTLGLVSGLYISFYSIGAMISSPIAGWLYDNYGFRTMAYFPATLILICVKLKWKISVDINPRNLKSCVIFRCVEKEFKFGGE